MPLPSLNKEGELPIGVHKATLEETLERFGKITPRRQAIAIRLKRIYQFARDTQQLARFVVFGSFITSKREPNDIDIFMIMEDSFDVTTVTGAPRLLFEHTIAQARFGASVFWVRKLAALGGEQTAVEDWQIKRNGKQRGIVEIISESS